ncbi:MAG TPA: PaaX family transcriptional regulator C-terminal domain-containing protein [Acidimicrobiales bacterium]|nr:PaaX family transcriptional regulator C-terminal domain-containing protein [Acidimicrobiales bacterium]
MLLSVLLGSHPPELPVRSLVRVADLFGISDGSARVALSRLNADGDVVAADGVYRLSRRLLQRQADQDRALRPATRPWRGAWDLAVARPGLSAPERSALGSDLARLRLAELRPGVWARPDNLVRPWPAGPSGRVWRFSGRPDLDGREPADLARSLWDLEGWAATSERLLAALKAAPGPPGRFTVAAAIVRHLRDDPVLPPSLLPRRWPGDRLRDAYAGYRRELADLLQRQQAR